MSGQIKFNQHTNTNTNCINYNNSLYYKLKMFLNKVISKTFFVYLLKSIEIYLFIIPYVLKQKSTKGFSFWFKCKMCRDIIKWIEKNKHTIMCKTIFIPQHTDTLYNTISSTDNVVIWLSSVRNGYYEKKDCN